MVDLLRPYVARLLTEKLNIETPSHGIEVPFTTTFDCTLVLLDISGFTPLSERLARVGFVGAEALTTVMSGIFGDLLTVASHYGADLVKFGGDALLFMLDGDLHEARGVRSATDLLESLRHIGAGTTEGVSYRLGASIGIASGSVTVIAAGTEHVECVLVGPTVDAVVRLESTAPRGGIRILPSTALAVPGLRSVVVDTTTHRLRGVAAPDPNIDQDIGERIETVSQLPTSSRTIPLALRDVLGTPIAQGEHRRAAVGFVLVTGLASCSPETLVESVHESIVLAQRACREWGVTFLGTDTVSDGFKILVVAGVPDAIEDAELRTATALRSILDEMTVLNGRAGMVSGRIFAGDIGSIARRTYSVLGDTVNLAARLMASAEPGTLRTTTQLADQLPRVVSRSIGPITVKGKRRPVDVAVVERVDRSLTFTHSIDHEHAMIGRESQATVLASRLHQLTLGAGGLLEITGEAGMGKSMLLNSVLMSASIVGYSIQASHLSTESPFGCAATALRAILAVSSEAELSDLIANKAPTQRPWLPLIARALRLPYVDTPEVRDLRPEYFQTRLELAVEDLLDVATDVPILITVDDAQHMDKASRSLLVRLCIRGNQRPRVVVLCGRTSMGEQIDGSERIALSTLSLESIEAVAREHANRPLREFEIADIVQRSAGNPMFAALLAAQIASTAVDDLPESIEDLLAARIDHLPFRARTVLRELSVFGANINRNLAAEVLGDQVLAAIDGPERVVLDPFIAFDATNLRFRLPLVASTAYASLRMTRRRELHSAIAEVVPDSEQCSLHLMLAARYNDAVSEAAAAAERAVDTGAPATAVALFGRALTCLAKSSDSTPQQHLDLTQRQGTIALRCGLFSEALHAYTTARRLRRRLGNSDADILLELSMVCERQGNLTRARSLVRQCIAACAANSSNDIFASSVVRSRALVHLAGIHYRAGRHQACYETCASVLASDMPRSEQHTRGHAMYLMGTAASELAKTDAPTLLRDAIAVLEPTDDHWLLAYALNNLGVDLYFRGRWDEAVEMYDQSQRAATRSGDRIVLEPSAWNNIGEVRSDQGRLDEAAAAFDEALRLWSSGPYPLGVAHATLNIGRVAMRRGHFAKARLQILEASNLAQERGMRDLAVEARLRLVECAIGADDLDQAAQLLDAIVSARETANTTQMLLPLVGRLEGIVAARCGHLDRSLAAFQTSVDAATAGHLRFELALTLAARLEMHPHRASQAELQSDRSEAQRIFKDLGVVNV